jgi:hypothetical protein
LLTKDIPLNTSCWEKMSHLIQAVEERYLTQNKLLRKDAQLKKRCCTQERESYSKQVVEKRCPVEEKLLTKDCPPNTSCWWKMSYLIRVGEERYLTLNKLLRKDAQLKKRCRTQERESYWIGQLIFTKMKKNMNANT